MKIQGARIDGFVARPDPRARVLLLYGPDSGLVEERSRRLVAGVVDDPGDPFRVGVLEADSVRADPARLVDEARAQSLIGGRRVVRLRHAGDLVTAAVRSLLKLDGLDTLVLLEAGELGPASSLRRLIEQADNAAALPCYRDEGRDLARQIEGLLAEHALRAAPDALAHLVEHLGADRAVTRSEIEKLALYLAGGDRTVRLEDAALLVGDSSALGLDDAVHAAARGDHARLETALARLLAEGQAPVRILRSLARHLLALHRMRARVDGGQSPQQAVAQARPPVHFRVRDAVVDELALWPIAEIEAALADLLEGEVLAKTTGVPDRAVCRRAAFALCRRAACLRAAGRSPPRPPAPGRHTTPSGGGTIL